MHVVRKRKELKIFMGDGGNPLIVRAMRGHANFVETVPLALVFLTLMALLGTPVWVLHPLGAILVVARLLHALHFCADDAPRWQRFWGTLLTYLVILVAAVGLIGHGVLNAF
ncbi:MAPEG family protein [Halovulum sp. GXIMD14793]